VPITEKRSQDCLKGRSHRNEEGKEPLIAASPSVLEKASLLWEKDAKTFGKEKKGRQAAVFKTLRGKGKGGGRDDVGEG